MKEKTVTLDEGQAVTIRELRTSEVIDLFQSNEGIKVLVGAASGLPSDTRDLISRCVDITPEELVILTEGMENFIKIENAFWDLNKTFLTSLPDTLERLSIAAQQFSLVQKGILCGPGRA